jgi:hypothetical protein
MSLAFDDVDLRGQIIGGDYLAGGLYFQGRKQGSTLYAKSESGIASMAAATLEEMQIEMGEAFSLIYRDGNFTARVFA